MDPQLKARLIKFILKELSVDEKIRPVIRGKRIKIKVKCPPGTKTKSGTCVPSGKSRISRILGAKKGVIKRFASKVKASRKRKASRKIRKMRGF